MTSAPSSFRRRSWRALWTGVVGLVACAALGGWQAAANVGREDLSRAYLALESALTETTLTAEGRAAVNRAVDSLTLFFFAGRNADAVRNLYVTVADAQGLTGRPRDAFLALASRANRFRPLSEAEPGTVVIDMLGIGESGTMPEGTQLIVVAPDGRRTVGPFRQTVPLTEARGDGPPPVEPGRWRFLARAPLGEGQWSREVPLGEYDWLPGSFRAELVALASRLAVLESRPEIDVADLAATRSRLRLLESWGDPESTTGSTSIVLEPLAILSELRGEIPTLEAGGSPWMGRRGDAWRTIRAQGVDVRARVLVPESLPADAQSPLLIALHGAGGDEHMFFAGYGQGLLARLARQRGLVVVAPQTATFAATPVIFDAIVAEMIRTANIDPRRVFVLGHSMGAAATGRIAERAGPRLAGIAMLAGASGSGRLPPTYVAAGALDPIIPEARISQTVERLRAAGTEVRFDRFAEEGHLLLVTTALPKAVDWLLALPPGPPIEPAPADRRGRDAAPATPTGP